MKMDNWTITYKREDPSCTLTQQTLPIDLTWTYSKYYDSHSIHYFYFTKYN